MDFIDKLQQLAGRVQRQQDSVHTEEATKTAFVLPFIQTLGYDVFNPSEVIPEFTADHGVKKGEKVDYAIQLDGKVTVLIECKSLGNPLEAKQSSQLFRYFSVTEARFGILTDGMRYLFFSDLEKLNQMDERPFFEFNLQNFEDPHVAELKKFTKSSFDLDTIMSDASNLKYHKALVGEIQREFENPSEDFVRIFTSRVYPGRVTQQIKDQFTELTTKALRNFLKEKINQRIQTALENNANEKVKTNPIEREESSVSTENEDGIETTEEEVEAHKIIQAIGAEIVDPRRIFIRDGKSYCSILLDDNNRRTLSRLFFGKRKMTVVIFEPSKENRISIESPADLFLHKKSILKAIQQYENPKAERKVAIEIEAVSEEAV